MSIDDGHEIRRTMFDALRALAGDGASHAGGSAILSENVKWHACHPIGDCEGAAAVEEGFWKPLHSSFSGLERRDDIFLLGDFGGDSWVAATGHYFGTFTQDFLDIPATAQWAYLRFGEVYRLHGGLIEEAFVIIDLVDLMRQAGVSPWRSGAGIEGYAPAPATQDGIRLLPADEGETSNTQSLVDAMLGSLFERDRDAMGMESYWAPEMMWYGPSMIGTTRGLDAFFRDHQEPWMRAFPDWWDGLEAPHFADGNYACYAGWPSIRATHTGDFLGLAPKGRAVDIRVMDWWRRDGALLAENWIFVDFPHLFMQLGVDLFEMMRARRYAAGE